MDLTLNPPELTDGHLWTLRELAAVVGVRPDSLRQRIARGTLPAVKLGRDWFVTNDHAARVILGKRPQDYVSAAEVRKVTT